MHAYKAQVLRALLAQALLERRNIIENVPDPVGTTASSEAESATDEQSAVERRATSDDIRGDTPEGGTDNQTDEERTCRESRVVPRNSEFMRQRVQSQSNTLDAVSGIGLATHVRRVQAILVARGYCDDC